MKNSFHTRPPATPHDVITVWTVQTCTTSVSRPRI